MHTVKRVSFWAFFASLIFAVLPLIGMLAAGGLAGIGGCELNEGDVNSCILLGLDIGGPLYFLFVAGWFVFFTMPAGVLAAIVSLVVYIVTKILIWRQKRAIPTQTAPLQ